MFSPIKFLTPRLGPTSTIEHSPTYVSAAPRDGHHPHIRALDGLRFLAAANVMIAHGYWYIVLMQEKGTGADLLSRWILSGAGIGMTLFFVLSGFVIHYNYHRTVPGSRSGTLQFYIARFARLYPLFLVVFGCDFARILWEQGYFSGYVFKTYDPFKALPFYLSFTQTWWWWPLQGTSAYEYYGTWTTGATAAMWSLSTEAFFYAAYPLFAGRLSRLSGRALAVFALGSMAFGLVYYTWALTHQELLVGWAAHHFPYAPSDQFAHWVLFQSPWGRISEFLLGASAAQAFLVSNRQGSHEGAPRLGRWLALASLIAFITPTAYIFGFTGIGVVGTQLCAAMAAVFAFAVARYRTRISVVLSHPFCVRLGDASYSLYLLHYFILHDYGQDFVLRYPEVPRWLIYIAMMTAAAIASLISYRFFERPALRWARANFLRLKWQIYLPAALGMITVCSMLLSVHMTAIGNAEPLSESGHISVSSASFGDNCNPMLHDNELGLMRRVCGNQQSCAFDYDILKIRDPAPGCVKRFQVVYSCGPLTPQREFMIERFDKAQMPIELSCN